MAAIAGCAWNSWMRRFCGLSIEEQTVRRFRRPCDERSTVRPNARRAASYHQRCCIG